MAGLIVAAGVSLLWCLFALWLGPRIGFVDRPDGSTLKVHEVEAVPLGGMGVFLGLVVSGALFGGLGWALLVSTAMVLVLGLVDDRRGLPPMLRLFVEVGAAAILVVSLESGDFLEMAIGMTLIVFAINAVNLFDGLDGLAGSAGLITALGIVLLASVRGLSIETALYLAGALAGFLVLGLHPARVFLGDAGAYVTGMVLAASMIDVSPGPVADLFVAAAMLGVFALDLVVTSIRRALNDRPLFEGDRSHVYDQLRDRGMSIPRVVYVAATAQVAVVLLVLAAQTWLTSLTAAVALALVGVLAFGLLARLGFLRVDSV